jgi:hypothetical protein
MSDHDLKPETDEVGRLEKKYLLFKNTLSEPPLNLVRKWILCIMSHLKIVS